MKKFFKDNGYYLVVVLSVIALSLSMVNIKQKYDKNFERLEKRVEQVEKKYKGLDKALDESISISKDVNENITKLHGKLDKK